MKVLGFTPLLQAEAFQLALVEAERAALDSALPLQEIDPQTFSEKIFVNALAKTGRLFGSERRFDSTLNALTYATSVLLSQRPRAYAQAVGFIPSHPTHPSVEPSADEKWSLPVPKEIVRPQKHSSHVKPLGTSEDETLYVDRELRAWLSRTRTSAKIDIGDLWYLLDQLASHGKKQDSLWVWLLDQLLWRELEMPSHHRIAQVLIRDFLVWFRDMVREEDDRVRILATSLKGPFYQKGYTQLVSRWERLRFLMKPLLDNTELASSVLTEAIASSLGDPKFDFRERLEVLENFTEKAGFDENGAPIDLFLVWVFAIIEAWQKRGSEVVLRLEEIFEHKNWGANEEAKEAHRQARQVAFVVALEGVESSPPNVEPLKDLLVMVHTTPLRKYEGEFLDIFKALAEIRPKNLKNFAAFLMALREEVNISHFFFADYENYETIVHEKLKSHLKETLPKMMTERSAVLIEMRNQISEADNQRTRAPTLRAYRPHAYLQIAQEVAQEQMQSLVKDILKRGVLPAERGRLWSLLKQNYRILMDEDQTFLLNKTLKVVVPEMISEVWDSIPRTELKDFLCHLKETTETLLDGVWVMPLIDPWENKGYLKDRNLYLEPWYMEATFKAVIVLGQQDPFLRLLQRELRQEIAFLPQSTQENILRSLYRSLTLLSLKRVLKEVAAALNVSL